MTVLVIDAQGGGLGRVLVEQIREALPRVQVIAVGTNALATQAMLKAGAQVGATGENAVCYNCGRADVILGPLGIVFANAIHGEISPAMARAVSESPAQKLLIPASKCNVHVMGTGEHTMAQHVAEALGMLREMA